MSILFRYQKVQIMPIPKLQYKYILARNSNTYEIKVCERYLRLLRVIRKHLQVY